MSRSTGLVRLDGGSGEGGGQILRTSLTLAMLTGRPFQIDRIRANRDKPGLRPQHLKAVESAAELADARVEGAAVGSSKLVFRPGAVRARDLEIDIRTAGSTALVLHTLHLPLAMRADRPIRLVITGGTFNPEAPSFPFLAETWRTYWAAMGLPVALAMPAAGFFPPGGGRLEAWIEPGTPQPYVRLERGPLRRVRGTAGVSNLPPGIAERMKVQAEERLAERGLEAEIETVSWPGPGQGAAFSLTAEHDGPPITVVGHGKRGKPAETVADEAVDDLLAQLDAPGAVDANSADQILLPLALADGVSAYTVAEVTEHLRTNVATIGAFLDRAIRIEEPAEGPARVVVA